MSEERKCTHCGVREKAHSDEFCKQTVSDEQVRQALKAFLKDGDMHGYQDGYGELIEE